MKRLIEVPVRGDTDRTVLVEVDEDIVDAGLERAARRGEVTGRAAKSIAEAIEDVRPAVDDVVRGFLDWARAPDELTVTFGIKLSGTLGGFLASAQAEGNFSVQVKWQRPQGG